MSPAFLSILLREWWQRLQMISKCPQTPPSPYPSPRVALTESLSPTCFLCLNVSSPHLTFGLAACCKYPIFPHYPILFRSCSFSFSYLTAQWMYLCLLLMGSGLQDLSIDFPKVTEDERTCWFCSGTEIVLFLARILYRTHLLHWASTWNILPSGGPLYHNQFSVATCQVATARA